MEAWAVSAHGSKQRSAARNNLLLPPGVEIVLYTPLDSELSSDQAWMLLAALRSNDEELALKRSFRTFRAYEMIPNLTAYGTKDFTSGIFKIGGELAKEALADGTEVTLHDIVYGKGSMSEHKGRIHWLACTVFDRPL